MFLLQYRPSRGSPRSRPPTPGPAFVGRSRDLAQKRDPSGQRGIHTARALRAGTRARYARARYMEPACGRFMGFPILPPNVNGPPKGGPYPCTGAARTGYTARRAVQPVQQLRSSCSSSAAAAMHDPGEAGIMQRPRVARAHHAQPERSSGCSILYRPWAGTANTCIAVHWYAASNHLCT